jgi:hypothetical protein
MNANLERDAGLTNLLNNESHFDYAARQAFEEFSGRADALARGGATWENPALLKAVGNATHHLQDQYALGHILPGTSLLRGAPGAPFRFIIHNVIGGEVAFRQASYDATRNFLQSLRVSPPVTA